MKVYKNIDDFYAENPVRLSSGETDFGVWWKSKYNNASHRISWIEKTGEFYVINFWTNEVCLSDKICKTKDEAEKFMENWAENCGLGTGHNLQEYFPEMQI